MRKPKPKSRENEKKELLFTTVWDKGKPLCITLSPKGLKENQYRGKRYCVLLPNFTFQCPKCKSVYIYFYDTSEFDRKCRCGIDLIVDKVIGYGLRFDVIPKK